MFRRGAPTCVCNGCSFTWWASRKRRLAVSGVIPDVRIMTVTSLTHTPSAVARSARTGGVSVTESQTENESVSGSEIESGSGSVNVSE